MRKILLVLTMLAGPAALSAQARAINVEISLLTDSADVWFKGVGLQLKSGSPRRSDATGIVVRAPATVIADLSKGDVIVARTDPTRLIEIEVITEWGGRIEAGAKRLIVCATPDGVVVFAAPDSLTRPASCQRRE